MISNVKHTLKETTNEQFILAKTISTRRSPSTITYSFMQGLWNNNLGRPTLNRVAGKDHQHLASVQTSSISVVVRDGDWLKSLRKLEVHTQFNWWHSCINSCHYDVKHLCERTNLLLSFGILQLWWTYRYVSTPLRNKTVAMAEDMKNPDVKPVPKGHRWILFVSGPTASGKSSVAKYLADELNLKFVEGDDVSSTQNLMNRVLTMKSSTQNQTLTRWAAANLWPIKTDWDGFKRYTNTLFTTLKAQGGPQSER